MEKKGKKSKGKVGITRAHLNRLEKKIEGNVSRKGGGERGQCLRLKRRGTAML